MYYFLDEKKNILSKFFIKIFQAFNIVKTCKLVLS